MKALVAGGRGFIGQHIVKDLVSKGYQVRVLLRKESKNVHLKHEQIELKYGDISDIHSLKECTRDVDVVYSAFGILGHWGIPEQAYWDINKNGRQKPL